MQCADTVNQDLSFSAAMLKGPYKGTYNNTALLKWLNANITCCLLFYDVPPICHYTLCFQLWINQEAVK